MGSVCDVVNSNGITEIETRSFTNLSKKLDKLLKNEKVTVVYPIPQKIRVIWVNFQSGECEKSRVSTKKGKASDVIPELYKIKNHLSSPSLTIKLIFLEEEHYKRRIGKRKGIREERVPVSFISELDIRTCDGIDMLFEMIPETDFTAKEFATANKLKGRSVWYGLQLLMATDRIEKIGQRGNAFIYRPKASSS
jgi:hypothetical protein